MRPQQLLRLLVLGEIADDYEEPNHIYENVARRATACGIATTQQLVELLLLELVEQGMAKAYDLRAEDGAELAGAPRLDQVSEYYFLITSEGLAAFVAARTAGPWPFDDEGDLVDGWCPPPE
jgi:hypothetical protein